MRWFCKIALNPRDGCFIPEHKIKLLKHPPTAVGTLFTKEGKELDLLCSSIYDYHYILKLLNIQEI